MAKSSLPVGHGRKPHPRSPFSWFVLLRDLQRGGRISSWLLSTGLLSTSFSIPVLQLARKTSTVPYRATHAPLYRVTPAGRPFLFLRRPIGNSQSKLCVPRAIRVRGCPGSIQTRLRRRLLALVTAGRSAVHSECGSRCRDATRWNHTRWECYSTLRRLI